MRTTVVIATRDRAPLLRVCLDSVAAQSVKADEVIVVDDGTDVATRDVCAAFDGVRLLASEGRGIGFARNVGLDAATGDIIIVQDDDDVMMPRRIEDHVGAFDDDTDVTFGGWINVDPEAPIARLAFFDPHPQIEPCRLSSDQVGVGIAVAVRLGGEEFVDQVVQ